MLPFARPEDDAVAQRSLMLVERGMRERSAPVCSSSGEAGAQRSRMLALSGEAGVRRSRMLVERRSGSKAIASAR